MSGNSVRHQEPWCTSHCILTIHTLKTINSLHYIISFHFVFFLITNLINVIVIKIYCTFPKEFQASLNLGLKVSINFLSLFTRELKQNYLKQAINRDGIPCLMQTPGNLATRRSKTSLHRGAVPQTISLRQLKSYLRTSGDLAIWLARTGIREMVLICSEAL